MSLEIVNIFFLLMRNDKKNDPNKMCIQSLVLYVY